MSSGIIKTVKTENTQQIDLALQGVTLKITCTGSYLLKKGTEEVSFDEVVTILYERSLREKAEVTSLPPSEDVWNRCIKWKSEFDTNLTAITRLFARLIRWIVACFKGDPLGTTIQAMEAQKNSLPPAKMSPEALTTFVQAHIQPLHTSPRPLSPDRVVVLSPTATLTSTVTSSTTASASSSSASSPTGADTERVPPMTDKAAPTAATAAPLVEPWDAEGSLSRIAEAMDEIERRKQQKTATLTIPAVSSSPKATPITDPIALESAALRAEALAKRRNDPPSSRLEYAELVELRRQPEIDLTTWKFPVYIKTDSDFETCDVVRFLQLVTSTGQPKKIKLPLAQLGALKTLDVREEPNPFKEFCAQMGASEPSFTKAHTLSFEMPFLDKEPFSIDRFLTESGMTLTQDNLAELFAINFGLLEELRKGHPTPQLNQLESNLKKLCVRYPKHFVEHFDLILDERGNVLPEWMQVIDKLNFADKKHLCELCLAKSSRYFFLVFHQICMSASLSAEQKLLLSAAFLKLKANDKVFIFALYEKISYLFTPFRPNLPIMDDLLIPFEKNDDRFKAFVQQFLAKPDSDRVERLGFLLSLPGITLRYYNLIKETHPALLADLKKDLTVFNDKRGDATTPEYHLFYRLQLLDIFNGKEDIRVRLEASFINDRIDFKQLVLITTPVQLAFIFKHMLELGREGRIDAKCIQALHQMVFSSEFDPSAVKVRAMREQLNGVLSHCVEEHSETAGRYVQDLFPHLFPKPKVTVRLDITGSQKDPVQVKLFVGEREAARQPVASFASLSSSSSSSQDRVETSSSSPAASSGPKVRKKKATKPEVNRYVGIAGDENSTYMKYSKYARL